MARDFCCYRKFSFEAGKQATEMDTGAKGYAPGADAYHPQLRGLTKNLRVVAVPDLEYFSSGSVDSGHFGKSAATRPQPSPGPYLLCGTPLP
jgi:hypothetical protein